MTKPLRTALLVSATLIAAPAWAQEHGAHQAQAHDEHAGMTSHLVEALSGDIEQVEQKLLALAEAMPDATWNWRPAEGVRSVGEVFLHVAADNYFLPALTGVAAPAETGVTNDYNTAVAYESRAMNKAATIEALRASFAHLRATLASVEHDDLMASHDFFGNQMSGTQVWVLTATHLHEHLGQAIAYARTNRVVPPWSRN